MTVGIFFFFEILTYYRNLTYFVIKGGGEVPKAFSGRIVVAAYWLFVVLMLATFTANLAG